MSGIRLDHVCKSFGRTVAVDDVTLTVEPGELFLLLGPSGCGKTTLLRLLAGFCRADRGTIHFGQRPIDPVPARLRNTGMVFQNYALWPHMTVSQNVAFGLDVRRVPRAERRQRVAEALDLVRMAGYDKRYPTQLSGGQQQRIALARALVIQPDILLLDEPLSNLDARLRVAMREEIRRIHDQTRVTTVYVTHDQKEALSLADRIAVMRDGRVVQVDTPETVYHRPGSTFVAQFVGETNLIEGRVVGRGDGGAWRVETAVGELTVATAETAPPEEHDVVCSIRPEALRVAGDDDTTQPNRLHVQVEREVFLGETRYLRLAVGAVHLDMLALGTRTGTACGTSLTVSVAPTDIVLLPGQPE